MKIFEGLVVSTKMNKTIVVEITRRTPHPLYKKLIKRSQKFNVDNSGFESVTVGDSVKIVETRPISKNKYFKVMEIVSSVNNESKSQKRIIEVKESELKTEESKAKKVTKKAEVKKPAPKVKSKKEAKK